MAFGYGFGSCGCSTWCTHRKLHDDPEIQWSKNVTGSDCDTGATVLDAAIDDGGNVYVVGHWNSTFDVYGFAKAYDSSGTVLWVKYYPRVMRCCSTDSTYLWIGGESSNYVHENAYKLDVSDGSTVWSVISNHETLNDCIHDGAGGVYFCGTMTGPGFVVDCGYASKFNSSGTVTATFGGSYFAGLGNIFGYDPAAYLEDFHLPINTALYALTATVAYSIDLDSSGNVYVGSDPWQASTGNCTSLDCGPTGSVAKFNSSHELVFLFGAHLCSAVRVAGLSLYCGFQLTSYKAFDAYGGPQTFQSYPACYLQKWLIADVTREWGRTLEIDTRSVVGSPKGVTDIDVTQSGVYVTHQWWVSKLDHDGNYLWSNRHAVDDYQGEEWGTTYYTVEVAPEDSYAYEVYGEETLVVGGRPALCEVEDQDDSETPATCDCEPEPVCEQTPNTIGPFGGIYSWICPGEEIPCSVPDTFYGSGCFDAVEVNHTWTWELYPSTLTQPYGRWVTDFEIPCGEDEISVHMEAAQVSATECTGWEITAELSGVAGCEASGAVTVTACWCSAESPYDHPWFQWEKTFDLAECDCCGGDGGGGNEPPGGVPSDCCASDLPTTLTITLGSSSCPAANGATGTLTYNATFNEWAGTVTVGGTVIGFALVAGSCTLTFPSTGSFDCYAQPAGEASSLTCDPLIATWNTVSLTGSNCCGGSGSISDLSVTITE